VSRVPFGYEKRVVKRQRGFLAHVDAGGGMAIANEIMPRAHDELPKFLSRIEIRSLLIAAENPHHRIILRLFVRLRGVPAVPKGI
jgi:integrase/recombinase XerD